MNSALNRWQARPPHVGRIAHAAPAGGILQRESTLNIDDLTPGEAKALVRQLLPLIEDAKAAPADAIGADLPERAVLVTTAHRGVFFGYLQRFDAEKKVARLRAARNCLYWPEENKGFLGLASMGPQKGSRVGPAADIDLQDVTCVATCTDEAVRLWESQPWK